MTKSELIAHLAAANPHLRQPDVELIEKRLKAVLARHKTSGR